MAKRAQSLFKQDDDAEVTSQSVEFDRVRDTDLAQHASHPKNNLEVQQKRGHRLKKEAVGKNRARMDR